MNIPAAIEVLTIFQKYETPKKPMKSGGHQDQIFLGNPSWKISEDDATRLTTLGLHLTEKGNWVFYT